jgi:ribosomal protein S18 acetylase RimI-like enzyme
MTGSTAVCEELPWDSSFFGVSIARVLPSRLDEPGADSVLEWCREKDIDCVYCLCALDDPATQTQLSAAGFQLVGVKVTLARPGGAGIGELRGRTRPARLDDIPRLRGIALSSHRDTRFHADGHFDPARCDELYATWIEKSVQGYADHVVVAERDETPVGYITLHLSPGDAAEPAGGTARIGLFAVDEQWRNQGVGGDLLHETARMLGEYGVRETTVVTAGRNVAALRLYTREGFRTTDVSLWYHRWFRDAPR